MTILDDRLNAKLDKLHEDIVELKIAVTRLESHSTTAKVGAWFISTAVSVVGAIAAVWILFKPH